MVYRRISHMRRTKSKNLNVYRLVLKLSLCNILKPGVKSNDEYSKGLVVYEIH